MKKLSIILSVLLFWTLTAYCQKPVIYQDVTEMALDTSGESGWVKIIYSLGFADFVHNELPEPRGRRVQLPKNSTNIAGLGFDCNCCGKNEASFYMDVLEDLGSIINSNYVDIFPSLDQGRTARGVMLQNWYSSYDGCAPSRSYIITSLSDRVTTHIGHDWDESFFEPFEDDDDLKIALIGGEYKAYDFADSEKINPSDYSGHKDWIYLGEGVIYSVAREVFEDTAFQIKSHFWQKNNSHPIP